MKRPILFSSLLLLLLFSGVFLGGRLTARSIDGIRQQVEALPESTVATPEEAEAIHTLWQAREKVYLLTLDHRVLADLDRAVSTLCGACLAGDDALYVVSRHELIAALLHLAEEAGNAAVNVL
ncbi:MAG: hypothetical protein IK090_01450 [Clostridia bacterium]|nr:hypothetical protein [Clostridia bacterium]